MATPAKHRFGIKRRGRHRSDTVRMAAAQEKAQKRTRDFRDKQPDTRRIKVELFHVCNHAFHDGYGRPCINSIIIDVLTLREFPTYYALLTVAAWLRAEPNQSLNVKIQFGGLGDIMRESPVLSLRTSDSGLIFVPFHMPHLRFDDAGEYVARIMDVDDGDYIMASRYIMVARRV